MASNGKISKNDLPSYQHVHGILLIGIHHHPLKDADRERQEDFRTQIKDLDHLAIEGYADALHAKALFGKFYETEAVDACPGSLIYLDEESQVTPTSCFGEDRHLALAGELYRDLIDVARTATTQNERIQIMGAHALAKKIAHPRWAVNLDGLLHALPSFCVDVDERPYHAMFTDAINAIDRYEALVRDHSLYHPQLQTFNRLQGKKGVVVGELHIEPLRALLLGTAAPLPSWNEYIQSLDGDTTYGIHFFRELAQEHLQTV
ncbi:hypothetical protein HYS47_00920 [Candidatus Woesearchaeota archaeon]|nr:hypothetical protein [Candidatus Woesearchaeota archaeon]